MKKYPKNLIFLDFDGVCNCKTDGSYLNYDPENYHASEQILDRLKSFCDENQAKIVIASNWRKFADDGHYSFSLGKEFKNPLPKLREQLKDYIFDDLPHTRHITKAQATILWFEENDFKGGYVIFDDDLREEYHLTYEYGIKEHFIHTDMINGLTRDNLIQAKEILDNEQDQ